MLSMPLYQEIARTLGALKRCEASDANESQRNWAPRHRDTLGYYLDALPSGSGWDCGTKLDMARSNPDKLYFHGSFHHMDENGTYDGWTEHAIIVTPSLEYGFSLRITGRDRNGIKDYLREMFDYALRELAIPKETRS